VKLQTDLREFIALLNSRAVEYLIVGGHAVAFHGYPRFTGDIDFFIRPTAENAARIVAVLGDFGFGEAGLDVPTLTQPDKVIQLGRPPNRIDLLTSISGVEFSDAWEERVAADLDGMLVQFIGKQSLLRNKRAAGRAKDLADVEALAGKPRP
jgi:predicted nucleotidyltransferase